MKRILTTIALVVAATAFGATRCPALTLDELIEKYNEKLAEATTLYEGKLKPAADAYLAELDEIRKVAEKGGSTLVLSAIDGERKIVKESGVLPKDAAASLPRQVAGARRRYQRAAGELAKARLRDEKVLKEKFERGLDSIEKKAKLEKDDALVARVTAERAKLAGAPDADKGFGKNLLRNADFSAGPVGPGTPPDWDNHDGEATVESEAGKRFVHLPGKGISQLVKLPEGTRKIHVALRLRAPDFKALDLPGSHKAGVHLYLEDAAGKLIKASDIEITRKERKWKAVDTEVKVADGVTQVRLMLFREGIEGALHADSITLEAFEK